MEQNDTPQDALAVIDEMIVQLRDHPGHELAIAIATRGKVLRDLGRPADAAESLHKAVEVTIPLSEGDPAAFEVMMDRFVEDYREACTEAGIAPDNVLLAAVEPYLPVK